MKEIILIKAGEIALKGLNRGGFEQMLIKNIKRRLKPLGEFEYMRAQSTFCITPVSEETDFEEVLARINTVFGIAAYTRALCLPKDMDEILKNAPEYLKETLSKAATFKVEAKRSDKKFPLTSPEICREVGGVLLQNFPHLKVDVHNPDVVVMVEIRDRDAYVHAGQITGAGGLPVGSSGKAALLISGGLDSPVAGYMMAKRGVELCAIHFESPPYTSARAREKVMMLLKKLVPYSGYIRCCIVPFTEIQEEIRDKCPEEYFTLIMRRFMMRIAEKAAVANDCGALITGESVGQVASQTMAALGVTDSVTNIPVFRPVIGMDKIEIIEIARKIDTFETSILPYEDCCTVFTPRHPRTNPKLEDVIKAESPLDISALEKQALDAMQTVIIK